jgi:tripeptide aminopeptidase
MSKVVDRFLEYVKVDTMSDETAQTVPSTAKQLVLAQKLCSELKKIGAQDVSLDKNGYVMAHISSNIDKIVPAIGFISHMDTSPEVTGTNVKPQIVENYDGGNIILNTEKNIVLSPSDFPELKRYKGETLITTDGNTLLGADDKAGVSEIMTAVEYIIEHPELKHGDISVAFTPDEEIGMGAHHFDVKKFKAEVAYTIDGGEIGELEYENFNAAGAEIIVHGRSVHPGSAKNKMKNSILIGNEFMNSMPALEVPQHTEGYEGFYHIVSTSGSVEDMILNYIIRDFDADNFKKRKEFISSVVKRLNDKYGEKTVEIKISDQYLNMKEKIEPVKYIVDVAFQAMKECGVIPKMNPIRGGTDGATLSYMGLPTPNIFTGGHNFHGRYEYIPVSSMEKAVEVIVKIISIYSTKSK